MIVDTATIAKAAGLTTRHIQRLAKNGTITPIELRTGVNGRPTMWFDLDTTMTQLDARHPMSLTDH